jgi:predicted ATPase
VIGRRFDPQLLAAAIGVSDVDARLAAMQALDLILRESKSDDYAFKHALVRDALYQSLLTEPRKSLHLKIAEEIERRSGNRLNEVAAPLQPDQPSRQGVRVSLSGRQQKPQRLFPRGS